MTGSSNHPTQRRRAIRPVAGFTLIELMVVVAIVAILAAVAFPSYREQVRKSRRAQAKADLIELTQNLERFRTVNNTYAGIALPFNQSPRAGTSHYALTVSGNTANAFLLTATPAGAQADDRCGTLTVNQAGVKTESGSADYDDCW
jgi:type IV pilus assembly protein PilE